MLQEFGILLKKCRLSAKLSQKQLIEKLREVGYEDRYGTSDVSKWEHSQKIPPEDIVEELEEILSTPKGLLLKAAGFTSAAGYRRFVAGGKEQDELTNLQWQQVEHIKGLQEFAKSVIESCPMFYPGLDSPEEIELFHDAYFSLWKLFNDLVHHAYWPSLAAHLSDGGQQIERMAAEITIESTCAPWEEPVSVSNELKARVRGALNLIQSGDLAVVASSGDTKEWEQRGLKPTCPFCPIKTLQTQT